MAGILEEIGAAYKGILNKPFTGYYDGEFTFVDTTGNTRMVLSYNGDVQYSALVVQALQEVEKIEKKYKTKIWTGVIDHWMYNLYIANESEITMEEAQSANTFVVYKVEAVAIRPELMKRWPYVCNLYVRSA